MGERHYGLITLPLLLLLEFVVCYAGLVQCSVIHRRLFWLPIAIVDTPVRRRAP
jgi:hypothetical protein